MALIIRTLFSAYTEAETTWGDSRSEDWFLMKSPVPVVCILASYVYFVKNLGPKLMENRKPFNIDNILIIYNVVQILASGYIGLMFLINLPKLKFWCQAVDYTSEFGLTGARLIWFYLAVKLCDLLDTVFFVLRKKQKQISFLHVYHHTGVIVLAWAGVKFAPGGTSLFIVGYNSIVHALMYTYYLYSVWDKKQKTNLWWKKHLTQLQLVQFGLLLLQYSTVLLQPDCEYPKWTACLFIPQNLFMIVMFSDFYIQSYMKNKGTQDTTRRFKTN